ncbi:MAG TPA: serpin family protein, partial [Allosphingosinicella sp.]
MLSRSVMLAAALLATSCASPPPEPREPAAEARQAQPAPPPDHRPAPASVVAGQSEFGVELYRRLGVGPGNLFISPASVSMALGMVYAGAERETAAEMERALRYPAGDV